MSHRVIVSCGLVCAAILTCGGCVHLENPISRFTEQRRRHEETQRQIARLQEHQGKLRKADELYQDLWKRDKNNVELCHRLAIVASKQEDWPRAMSYFERAIKLAPDDAKLQADYGYALYLSGDLQGAEAALREALVLDSRNERASNNLAIVLGEQERFDEAYEIFRRAVGEAEAHANIAYLYAQCGYGQKAVEHYSRALELEPKLEAAQQGLLQLAQFKQRVDQATGRSIASARECGTERSTDSQCAGKAQAADVRATAEQEPAAVEPLRGHFASAPSESAMARARALLANRREAAAAAAVQLASSPGARPEAPQSPFEVIDEADAVQQVHFEYEK